MLLWAGPLSMGLALVVLLASRAFFRHGPGVPTAGDERAWGAMWAALGLVMLGCATGLVANVAWVAWVLRAGRRPGSREWFRFAVGVLMGAGFLLWWFAP
jgi:hypothetical protein